MDFGKSKIRVGAINKEASKKNFFYESNYFTDYSSAEIEIEKIITNLEKNTNEYFQLDPTLPYITNKTIECVNEDCPSKTTSKKEIKFIKYDEVNLKYMYLCCVCGQKWTNEID